MAGTESEGRGARPISVEQLIALNDEIAALARAGSPLERGLARSGEELPGRLNAIAAVLAERMRRGESLVEALESQKRAIPPLYRAVVEAGARSGDVATALQGMSRYLKGYSEARSAIGLALWYPILVVTLAYALFLGVILHVVPRFREALQTLQLPVTRPLSWLEAVGQSAWYWWPVWPILLILVAVAWRRSALAARFDPRAWTFLGLFPWTRSLLRDYQSAGFAELLALLLEHKVGYPQAVTIAAEATGDPRMIAQAGNLSRELERGQPADAALRGASGKAFSPLLRWALASGREQGSMVQALRNLAPMYRKRAAFKAAKIRLFLPTILMIVVGASVTLLYALTLFLPLTGMLSELAGP